jgi:hypothetical protein
VKKPIPDTDLVRSAWRRVKENIRDMIARDLQPVKDVKGGGGVAGKPTTGGTRTTAAQAATNSGDTRKL